MKNENLIFTPVSMHGSQAGMKKDLRFMPVLPEGLSSAGHSLRGRGRFTPSFEGMGGRVNEKFLGYTLDWWTETALYYYGALMVSAFYGLEKDNFRDYYKIPRKNFLFITDSGGFQIFSQRAGIDPQTILDWQERNADVGMTLDVPPLNPNQTITDDFTVFKRASETSKRNYEIMHKVWSGKLELLKVIHGSNPKQLNYWFEAVKDLEFSGYSFSPKPVNVKTVATVLGYAKDIGAKKVHIFLGSGETVTPIMVYAGKWFDRLTFDSSSFSTAGARYRRYYLPYKVTRGISFGKNYKGGLKELPCTCPVCQLATVRDMLVQKKSDETFGDTASLPGGLIALHNLYVYLRYYNFLRKLSDDNEAYKDFLLNRGLKKTVDMLNFLDRCESVGFMDAYSKMQMGDQQRTEGFLGEGPS